MRGEQFEERGGPLLLNRVEPPPVNAAETSEIGRSRGGFLREGFFASKKAQFLFVESDLARTGLGTPLFGKLPFEGSAVSRT